MLPDQINNRFAEWFGLVEVEEQGQRFIDSAVNLKKSKLLNQLITM